MDNGNIVKGRAQAPIHTNANQMSNKERWSYCLYSFGQMSFYCITMGFVQVYMTDIGITAAAVGVIILVARVWDAINDPLFGVIVNKSRLKGGRYKPWLKLSSFLLLFITVALFAIPSGLSIPVKTILAAVLYIAWGMSYTVCDVPYFSITTAMTNNVKERNSTISFGRMFTMIGMAAVGIFTPLLYPAIGWLATAILCSVVAFSFMLPFSFIAKERYTETGSAPTLKQIFKIVTGNKYLMVFCIGFIVANTTNTVTSIGSYFAIHNLGGPHMIAITTAVPMLFTIVVFAFIPALIKRFEKYYLYMGAIAAFILLSVAIYFAGYQNLPVYLALSALRGACSNFIATYVAIFVVECAEYGRFKTGEDTTAVSVSIQTFGAKAIGAIAGSLGMFTLGLVGFVQGTDAVQPPMVLDALWLLMSLVPIIGMVAAFVILLFGYKLRDRDVQIMARVNQGELTRQEAEKLLSRKY